MARTSIADQAIQQFSRRLALFAAEKGYAQTGSIPEEMTFIQWVEDLGSKGLKVDRRPFSLADRPALRPIYEAIPTTRAEAFKQKLVIQKATQLGLTVWEVLAQLYMSLKFSPVNIGMFMPDQSTAGFKSEQRFMAILRSAPMLYERLITRQEVDGSKKKIGEGNVLTRQFGESLLMFLWTSGRVTTESRPMDIVSLDEVQEMALAHIDKVIARMGDSDLRFTLMLSTANQPELDINYWYLQGNQEVWHTRCLECGEESDLSDPGGIFPGKSTAYNTGQVAHAPHNEFVYVCPRCRAWIRDAQIGRYIPQQPGNLALTGVRSFLLPRTISPKMTARDLVTDFNRAKTGDQKKSFYNRTLARPYIDADQLPVTLAHLREAARKGMEMGLTWQKSGRGTFMGVDQMGGFNVHIIKGRLPDGRQGVLHVEAVFGNEAFGRTAELMDQYGVQLCVIEQLPNANEARKLAARFPRRVYLAGYANLRDDMLVWGDDLTKSDRRTAESDRSRWTVTIQQYKAMQMALFRLRDGGCLFPDPAALEQMVQDTKGEHRIPICQDWVFDHFTKTALVMEQDEKTRKPVGKVQKVGLDPHFSFANMLCDIAWIRNGGGTTFMLLENGAPDPLKPPEQTSLLDTPGLPPSIQAMIEEAAPNTCGACEAFRDGHCTAREFRTQANAPACFAYIPAS
ncbi:hypothetical protein EOD42_22615 [Rhodovarius crocodyli]|uniref:Phage terminase large subunit GpA ATPase domain-containing protein n=1 Tax=Rhodovarius crocodyli TaxID=1979269 RepID=A0A437M1H2_9PROT|nr:phage terminase large subunit family protein [Rhodovarius crocodyli]RVT91452.1 hypothetical protein EOD42_22615 [Rhodovarius crocodyli]